ncbi:hypothetical protein [Mesorhizobium sp. SP-1A]|uniref:hypothetical protein n=1 Tax=Mesorhizobium sp. SP-1A TaxID=3077840 RepID=UPI0028F6E2EB|nr:hypothetical protein [Mesorhizobium sp. SP-1A]
MTDVMNDLDKESGSSLLSSVMLAGILDQIDFLKGYPLTKLSGVKRWKVVALDVFGDFFVRSGGKIYFIRTETGKIEETWSSYDDWLKAVIDNPDEVVGLEFLLAWEEENGRLPDGHRLTPKVPFILGGTYDFDNIVACPLAHIMQLRTALATQLVDVPDGGRVKIEWVG